MYFVFFYIMFFVVSCSLVWSALGFDRVSRSPGRIALVGLFICGVGFLIQVQVHQTEAIHDWMAKIPIFEVDHSKLEFISKFIDVVVYAAGGGVIASALILRTQACFERQKWEQQDIRERAVHYMEEHKRALKFLQADALIYGIADVDTRRELLITLTERERHKFRKANRILKSMGVRPLSTDES